MAQRIVVDSGRCDDVQRYINEEDGWERFLTVWSYRVSFRTPYGLEYVLRHAFPDTAAGAAHAAQTAAKVQAKLDTNGVDGLDEERWNTRVMYGTQAYLDEEPFIVEREKADALMGFE